MKLLRKTTPVALTVGAAVGTFLATLQAADGIFGNPILLSSAGVLFSHLLRTYILHIFLLLAVMFLVNLSMCVVFPNRMREADYHKLLQYYTCAVVFIVLAIFSVVLPLIQKRRRS